MQILELLLLLAQAERKDISIPPQGPMLCPSLKVVGVPDMPAAPQQPLTCFKSRMRRVSWILSGLS